ncbi:MAG TPA: hypothetical protein PL082_01550 [Tepidiformaceae bacterium]|nr:hypothetical protein [Tepidiformaceae bacterium]
MSEPPHPLAVHATDNTVRVIPGGPAAGVPGWWPSWRPGRAEFTATRLVPGGNAPHTALVLCAASGGEILVPGSMATPPALISERLPHYALWNPQGTVLYYVMPTGRTLAARIWRAGDAEARTLTGGTPIFTAWTPAGDRLAIHHGSELAIFEAGSGERQLISGSAGGFRVPAVSQSGRWIAYAEVSGETAVVHAYDTLEAEARRVAEFGGGVILAFRPGTEVLTVAGVLPGGSPIATGIHCADLGAPDAAVETLVRGPVVAFWWAPAGDRLAVLTPGGLSDGRVQVRFYGTDGWPVGAMESLSLSNDMRTLVGFFDQFALSHSLWSPDGRHFTLAGRLITDGPASSFADGPLDSVLTAEAGARAPWQTAGRGSAGFFPPPQVNGG